MTKKMKKINCLNKILSIDFTQKKFKLKKKEKNLIDKKEK